MGKLRQSPDNQIGKRTLSIRQDAAALCCKEPHRIFLICPRFSTCSAPLFSMRQWAWPVSAVLIGSIVLVLHRVVENG
eukprot:476174-Prymnesium_polylepis.1